MGQRPPFMSPKKSTSSRFQIVPSLYMGASRRQAPTLPLWIRSLKVAHYGLARGLFNDSRGEGLRHSPRMAFLRIMLSSDVICHAPPLRDQNEHVNARAGRLVECSGLMGVSMMIDVEGIG